MQHLIRVPRSHATYYFIAAGCHWSLGNYEESQRLFDAIPGLIEKKIGGKDLPTEVFIKKKGKRFCHLSMSSFSEIVTVAFYQNKQKRLGRKESFFVEAITINPAEGMSFPDSYGCHLTGHPVFRVGYLYVQIVRPL
jgi:hypothetical protein